MTGITGPIQDSKISLFFDNNHDQINIFYDTNLITTVDDVAARQWYDIDLPDIITENKPYTFLILYDENQEEWEQEDNRAELTINLQSQEAPNQAPIASFVTEPAFGEAPLTVEF